MTSDHMGYPQFVFRLPSHKEHKSKAVHIKLLVHDVWEKSDPIPDTTISPLFLPLLEYKAYM